MGYFRGLRAPVPVYAVPTTSGTGSEVTVAAVISDPEAGAKLVIADTRLVPTMAALDPTLMVGLPKEVTAATGMDALTHAVEAFIGQWANDSTDRMALAAVGLVYGNLPVAFRSPRNLEARERMALAAAYAGLAFTRANVGYVHAIAHQLGGKYHTPHGLANAIMLPHVLEYLAPAITKRLALLAVAAKLGKEGERAAVLARRFLASIEAMNRELGIPETLAALREADIPALASAACWEADTNYPVPKYMSQATCEAILRKVLPEAGPAGRDRPADPAQVRGGPQGVKSGRKSPCGGRPPLSFPRKVGHTSRSPLQKTPRMRSPAKEIEAARTSPSIEELQLRGISRTVAEIHWLLLILVLVYLTFGDYTRDVEPAISAGAFFYAAFVMSFRYAFFFTAGIAHEDRRGDVGDDRLHHLDARLFRRAFEPAAQFLPAADHHVRPDAGQGVHASRGGGGGLVPHLAGAVPSGPSSRSLSPARPPPSWRR